MGNKQSKKRKKQSEKIKDKSDIIDDMDHIDWVSEVKKMQQNEQKIDIQKDDYSLFISYLALQQTPSGYSEVSIIARIVRIYVGDAHGMVLFDDNNGTKLIAPY